MDAIRFRRSVRRLERALGVLDESRTPSGVKLSVREVYALAAMAGSTLSLDLVDLPGTAGLVIANSEAQR